MRSYPIPEALAGTADGPEWAIAAILEGRAVAVLYLADVAPELLNYVDTTSSQFIFRRWARIGSADLQALHILGDVFVGVITECEFAPYMKLLQRLQ